MSMFPRMMNSVFSYANILRKSVRIIQNYTTQPLPYLIHVTPPFFVRLQVSQNNRKKSAFETQLSKRCNCIKMIATNISVRIIFVQNVTRNIFSNLIFFAKAYVSRENREEAILASRFDPLHSGDCAGVMPTNF